MSLEGWRWFVKSLQNKSNMWEVIDMDRILCPFYTHVDRVYMYNRVRNYFFSTHSMFKYEGNIIVCRLSHIIRILLCSTRTAVYTFDNPCFDYMQKQCKVDSMDCGSLQCSAIVQSIWHTQRYMYCRHLCYRCVGVCVCVCVESTTNGPSIRNTTPVTFY